MNVIERLEFELTYNDFAVHRFNHYTKRTPHHKWLENITKIYKKSIDFVMNIYLPTFLHEQDAKLGLVIEYLEFEHVNYDVKDEHVSHYETATCPIECMFPDSKLFPSWSSWTFFCSPSKSSTLRYEIDVVDLEIDIWKYWD